MAEKNNDNQYQESLLLKWIFRISSVFIIIFFCFLIIHFEFRELAKNKHARDSAERMIDDVQHSAESLQDAWNTIYYFYQTGDLLKIMKCPTVSKTNNEKNNNTLLMLYREDVSTEKLVKNNDISSEFKEVKNLRCGGNITINIGLKKEIHKHPIDSKNYTFKLGEEPLELVEKYPFVKYALNRLRFGEKATFIALPVEKKIFKPKKQTIYEISIPTLPSTEVINTPIYMPVRKNDEKFEVDDHAICGSVVQVLLKITDLEGNKIFFSDIKKIKVGSGLLNESIEQVITQMRIGDRYKILLTKQMFKPTEILNMNIFKKSEIVIVDLVLINVQK